MKYRVKPGYRHGVNKQYGPGDIVEIDPQAAAGFLDKLEPVGPEMVVIKEPPPRLWVPDKKTQQVLEEISAPQPPETPIESLVDVIGANLCNLLITNGFYTVESLRGATDEELTKIRGIGPGTVRKLKEAINDR